MKGALINPRAKYHMDMNSVWVPCNIISHEEIILHSWRRSIYIYIFIRFPLRISILLLISDLSGATLRAPHEDLFIATRRDYLLSV